MDWLEAIRILFLLFAVIGIAVRRPIAKFLRVRRYTRGRQLVQARCNTIDAKDGLRWGNTILPQSSAVRHWLCVGTTGSGKSLVQRMLMKGPLLRIKAGSDQRALIFDAKGDTSQFLQHIGIGCPVFNLNPFAEPDSHALNVAWDVAKDIDSPARAQNLASSLIPSEKSGNNQYFTDAARQVLIGVIESLIQHSPLKWTFADLVYISMNRERIESVLSRDPRGSEVMQSFFGDEKTAYQVLTTIVSRMAYFKPVAALWQRTDQRLSIKDWLNSSSVLLIGSNATVKTSLDAINQQMFRVMVEEIDVQSCSESRRTWVWIDEARLAGPLLQSDMLPYLAVKGRSAGAAIVLAFQDIDGFREAAGERIANEIVAQCSNKALLRMESESSAAWASRTLGQYETIEWFRSENSQDSGASESEQRVQRDAVLPSEFFGLSETNKVNGLTGFFVSPTNGASKQQVTPADIQGIVFQETSVDVRTNLSEKQWMLEWTEKDIARLRFQMRECDEAVKLNQKTKRSLTFIESKKSKHPSWEQRSTI